MQGYGAITYSDGGSGAGNGGKFGFKFLQIRSGGRDPCGADSVEGVFFFVTG
jgi:hypothetical protein